MANKIKSYDEIGLVVAPLQADNKRVVHCHGVYDLLHVGHIKHLEAARQLGDILVVSITPDRFVNKGPHRPVFPASLRAEALAALGCVDYVTINNYPTAVEIIRHLRPDVYVKGTVVSNGKRDHTDAIVAEEIAVKSIGGQLVLTDEETFSASSLINRFMDIFTPEAKTFLESFRQKYSPEKIVEYIESIRKLKVLTIGDAIIDEYVFCDSMGKANKEAALVVGRKRKEAYAGGVMAIANHIGAFCDQAGMLTALGDLDSHESFITDAMRNNVATRFVRKRNQPTLVKRRYVEEYLQVKLFEVYNYAGGRPDRSHEESFMAQLETILPEYDVVIVADYGHGLITDKAIDLICSRSKFLAVNTQTNAGNLGYNLISKYPRADFISIAEPELRLENRDLEGNAADLIVKTAEKLDCPRMMVTQGKRGCLSYDRNEGVVSAPAFSVKIVDRIGAGDALLSLAAPCAALGLPQEVVSFVGNVAGAEACAIMGNKDSIEPVSLYRHITSLLS